MMGYKWNNRYIEKDKLWKHWRHKQPLKMSVMRIYFECMFKPRVIQLEFLISSRAYLYIRHMYSASQNYLTIFAYNFATQRESCNACQHCIVYSLKRGER